jgi:predicted Zn-dependent protease
LEARVQLALCQDELGEKKRARGTLEKLRHEFPNEPSLDNTLGYLLAERGEDLDYAEELVRRALEDDPENGAYLDSLAWIYYQRGDYEQAFELLVRAANAIPEDPVILEHLGRTLQRLGRAEQALGVLRRALDAGADPEVIEMLLRQGAEEAHER